jgi:hypothetical protein
MRILILASIAFLMGCQGQNPFKRQSDPTKAYPHTMESSNRPYVPGQKAAKPGTQGAAGGGTPAAPAEPPCFEPVTVEASPDHGNDLLKFVEETEGAYDLKITLGGPQTQELKIDRPENSDLRMVARQDNTYTYRLTWKPAKGASAGKNDPVVVGFEGELPKGACPQAKNRVSLSVVVSKTNDVPGVSFEDMKEKIKFGDKFEFRVVVQDPLAVRGKTPTVKWSYGEERGSSVLDASAAVTGCKANNVREENKYEFLCQFDSNLIKKVEKLLSTGKEAYASFRFVATSAATGVQSPATPQKIKVLFEKIETKTTGAPK